jgi:hypothetical protein
MIVRALWENCPSWARDGEDQPIDAYWVECSPDEYEQTIKCHLPAQQICGIEDQIQKFGEYYLCDKTKNLFFLISKDLHSIQLTPRHYAFSPMWNGYNPFQGIPTVVICSLEELTSLRINTESPDNNEAHSHD